MRIAGRKVRLFRPINDVTLRHRDPVGQTLRQYLLGRAAVSRHLKSEIIEIDRREQLFQSFGTQHDRGVGDHLQGAPSDQDLAAEHQHLRSLAHSHPSTTSEQEAEITADQYTRPPASMAGSQVNPPVRAAEPGSDALFRLC